MSAVFEVKHTDLYVTEDMQVESCESVYGDDVEFTLHWSPEEGPEALAKLLNKVYNLGAEGAKSNIRSALGVPSRFF